MSAAFITIEDEISKPAEDGTGVQVTVSLKLVFSGGFNPQSPAQQAAQALLKLWDEQMALKKIGEPIIDPVVVAADPMLAVVQDADAAPAPMVAASRIVVEHSRARPS